MSVCRADDSAPIPYACRTGTRRNLLALREAGWRLLLSPTGVLRTEGFPYGLDNGAWTYHQRGVPFDSTAFRRAIEKVGEGADFIVAPDIVCGGHRSLALSLSWLDELRTLGPRILLPIQPGVMFSDVATHVGPSVGVFLGGDTAWKEAAILTWGPQCVRAGVYCHVGRVNTARRVALCNEGQVSSFDGSSASRFAVTLPPLDAARLKVTQLALGVDPC